MVSSRHTLQRALILRVMLEAPAAEWYGLEISKHAGLKSGTIYPALAALEKDGLLTSAWEDIDPSAAGRPRRRLYRLVPEAIPRAQIYVANFAILRPPRRARREPRYTPRSQTT